jgi:hypothetical protein
VALKESPDKTASAKSSEILAGELFSHMVKSFVAFVMLFRYILFHFLGASSTVFKDFVYPSYTIVGGIFH